MIRAFLRRLSGLFSRARSERELSDEIEFHLRMRIGDHIRAGMAPDEARRLGCGEVVERSLRGGAHGSRSPGANGSPGESRFLRRNCSGSIPILRAIMSICDSEAKLA